MDLLLVYQYTTQNLFLSLLGLKKNLNLLQ